MRTDVLGARHSFNEDTYSEIAKNGHLDCLKYLHENRASRPSECPWSSATFF